MSNKFINDHRGVVRLRKIIKITAGGFHSWCEVEVAGEIMRVRKPNNIIPQILWDKFYGKEPQLRDVITDEFIAGKKLKEKKKLSLWQRIWNWFKGQIQNIIIKNQKRWLL